MEIPWRVTPKTPYDEMYDFLLRAPVLQNQGIMLRYLDRPSQLQLATEMIRNCWDLDTELESVYNRLGKNLGGPVFWPELARDKDLHGDSDDGLLFPVAFHFSDLSVASTVLMYWSVQCILWNGLWQLYRLMEELRVHFAAGCYAEDDGLSPKPGIDVRDHLFKLRPLDHRSNFATPCRNIFQSVEYTLQADMLEQGPKCIAGPLQIAFETLRPYCGFEKETAWAERARERIQGRCMRLLMYYTPSRGQDAQTDVDTTKIDY
jgi:hypothetical protein